MKQSSMGRTFFRYASFNVLGMAGLSCYILADTFFVSKGLGADGLTALNLAIPVYSLIYGTGLMLGMGGGISYAVARGQQAEEEERNRIFTRTLQLSCLFGLIFLAIGLWGAGRVTRLLGADHQVFAITKCYVRMILLFAPAFVCNNLCLGFVRNDGNPSLAMLGMVGGSLSNVVLDYIFIFPLNMGMFGAVLATCMAPIISLCILSVHKWQKKNQFHLTRTWMTPQSVGKTLSLGLPTLVTELSSGVVILVFNWLMLKLSGNVGVAAYGVIANLSLVVVAIYNGVGQGMQPLVSEACGRGERKQMHQVLRYGLVTVMVLSVVIYGLILLFTTPIAAAFNSEHLAQLQTIAEQGLRVYFVGILFADLNILFSAFFAATERPMPAHGICWMRGFILIVPMAMVLSMRLQVLGLWLAFPLAEGLTALGSIGLYLGFTKKEKMGNGRS
jgi:putative MATE family efflux protein